MKEHLSPGEDADPTGGDRSSVQLLLELGRNRAERKEAYRAGELLREFRITRRDLRFYEGNGILEPARAGSKRRYSSRDRMRLRCALLSEALGFSAAEAMLIADYYTKPDA